MPLLRSIHLIATIFTLTIIFASTIALASASTAGNTTTSVGGGGGEEQEALSSTTNTTNSNVSNAALGSLFLVVEFERTSVNPVNKTYIETTAVSNLTMIPPNATTTTTINATLTSNATVNTLPNGLNIYQGQSLIVTEGDNDGGTAEQENATTAFVDISRTNPDGAVVGTGVLFFSTNSTGQLAFLDNMVGISQSEFSSEGGTIRMWEWKGGGTLPFESSSDGGAPTTGNNQTIIASVR